MDSNRCITNLSLPLHLSDPGVLGSFHVSFLAGRILLKDFRYHSSNQTFKIVKVQLRWQYWIRTLTHSEDIQTHGCGEGPKCAPTFFPSLPRRSKHNHSWPSLQVIALPLPRDL